MIACASIDTENGLQVFGTAAAIMAILHPEVVSWIKAVGSLHETEEMERAPLPRHAPLKKMRWADVGKSERKMWGRREKKIERRRARQNPECIPCYGRTW